MNILKKSTAVFMIMLTLLTIVPFSSFAKGNRYDTQTQSKVNYKGTNALGTVLSDAMEEENEEQQNDGYFILDVAVEGQTATVNYSAPDGATLIVAVYDEEGTRMITSAKAEVDSSAEQVEVTFNAFLPTYFLIKAFILDSENAPVCRNFESIKYTEAFQDFLEKKTTDFDEEKVINLDESTDNNFAVVSDDAQVIEQTESENILVVNDGENGIYTFENAGDEIINLDEGDVFYFVYGEGAEEYILTKVGDIKFNKGTVTITAADEYEISDFFSYIKIDTEQAEEEQEDGNLKYAGDYDEDSGDVDEETSEINIKVEETFGDENFNTSFTGYLKFKFYLQFYYDFHLWKEDYYEITQTATVSFVGETTIKAQAEKEFLPINLFTGSLPIFAGLDAEVKVQIKVVVSAELYVTGGIEFKMVNGSRKISGKPDEDLSKDIAVVFKFDAGGKLALEITPLLSVGFEVLKVIDIAIEVGVGVVVTGTIHFFEIESDESLLYPDEKHNCDKCIDGDINFKAEGFVKVNFGISEKKQKTVLEINLFTHEKKLCDFYIQLEWVEENVPDPHYEIKKVGIGTCPNITYKVTYKVVDEENNPLADALVYDGTDFLFTDVKGEVFSYYANGTYTYEVTHSDCQIDTDKMQQSPLTFVVKDKADTVNVYMKSGALKETLLENTWYNEIQDYNEYRFYEDGTVVENPDSDYPREMTYTLTGDILRIYWDESESPYTTSLKYVSKADNCDWEKDAFFYYDVYSTIEDGEYFFYEHEYESDGFNNAMWLRSKVRTMISSGTCGAQGDNVTWTLYDNGDLVISGSGDMKDYGMPGSPFAENDYIKNVVIESGVTSIGDSAFSDCQNLENIIIPDGLISIGIYAFDFCNSLTSITIPDSVTSIGAYAFYGCDGLESVTIGSGVTSIDDYVFFECDSLESITIPGSVTNIGVSVFKGCDELTSVIIGSGVTSIGSYAFKECWVLENITIPDSVTSIGGFAFEDTLYQYKSSNWENKVLYIGNHLIEAKDSISGDYEIKAGTKCIADKAFYGCDDLTSVTISDSVISIGEEAFNSCDSLESVTIPYGVTSIRFCTFAHCRNLKSVVIPDGVTNIGGSVFSGCVSLESLVIPDSVTFIGTYAFSNCNSLTDIYYTGTQEQWDAIEKNQFNQPPSFTTVHFNYVSSGVYSSPVKSTSTLTTETTGSISGYSYVMAVVYDGSAEDLFEDSNLIFIDQKEADGETLTFSFMLDEDLAEYDILFYSADLTVKEEIEEPDAEPDEEPDEEPDTEPVVTPGDVEESTTEEPVTEPSTEETTTELSTTEESETELTTGEPTTELPTTEEPVTEPSADETTTGPSMTEEPATEPSTTRPTTAESSTTQPTTTKPTTTKPVPTVPSTTAPSVTKPVTPETPEQPTKAAKPARVKIKSVKSPKKKRVTVVWEKIEGANGYQVYCCVNKKFKAINTKKITVKKADKLKTTFKKLRSKKKYFVKVRAYKVVNGEKLYGKWSKVKKVKVK